MRIGGTLPIRKAVRMSRCDYCEYRNCAECEHVGDRVSNDVICNDFKLDFDTLSDREKKTIQKRLMKGGKE